MRRQFSSVAQSCPTVCDPMDCGTPGLPVHHQLPEFTQTHVESMMPSNHLILCHPLLFLPSILPSIRVFSNELALHIRWPKYWSFSFNISPSNEYSGLISLRMDWLDLLAVQGTLKSLLQYHSSKASILRCSAFVIVQLSHPYMTTGKTISMTVTLSLHGCKLHHPCLETFKPLTALSLSPNPSPCDTCKLTTQRRAVPVPGGWSSNPTLLTFPQEGRTSFHLVTAASPWQR